jgi:hypothetical protein
MQQLHSKSASSSFMQSSWLRCGVDIDCTEQRDVLLETALIPEIRYAGHASVLW